MNQIAWELCHDAGIDLTPQGRSLLRADQSARSYIDLLMERGCYADARRVLAHALPKRRALWWACACTRDLYLPTPSHACAVLDVVSHYVEHGDEVSRRRAEAVGMEFGPDDLLTCLAMAAFFSGDNVSRPDLPPVAPAPRVVGNLVEVVVYLCSVRKNIACYKDQLRRYLEQGLQISVGPDPWMPASDIAAEVVVTAGPPLVYAGETP